MADPPPTRELPSLAGADWLVRPQTRAVFDALAAGGFAARAVGGAVRNALLGRPVVDIDIATPARPEQVMAAARAAGLAAVPTGLAHGTVTVIADHVAHEVTTLREDVETHGRHATVAFTDDWAADARRRDFTINALYCSADGEVFDPLGAEADLAARRVRFIGEARQRIREDYLRILRFFRLTAEYGEGPPDPDSLAACVAEREGLARLSAERVRQELLRLLAAPRGPELVRAMQDYGVLAYVLPAAPRPALLARLAAIEAALGLAGDAVLRLAALAVELPDDADRLRDRLRLSNEEHAQARTRGATHARHRCGLARGCGQGQSLRRWRGGLPRARADGLGARECRTRRGDLARPIRAARALAGAALPAQRRRRRGPWRRPRPARGRAAARRGGRVDRRRLRRRRSSAARRAATHGGASLTRARRSGKTRT